MCEVSSVSSHAVLHAAWSIASSMTSLTCHAGADQLMQQSDAASDQQRQVCMDLPRLDIRHDATDFIANWGSVSTRRISTRRIRRILILTLTLPPNPNPNHISSVRIKIRRLKIRRVEIWRVEKSPQLDLGQD